MQFETVIEIILNIISYEKLIKLLDNELIVMPAKLDLNLFNGLKGNKD